MNKFFIKNQRGNFINITDDVVLGEFFISEKDIIEHFKAQIQYFKEKNHNHKFQPVIIGIDEERFVLLVNHICNKYKGFWRSGFLNSNKIGIRLTPTGNEIIQIVNSDIITKNTTDEKG